MAKSSPKRPSRVSPSAAKKSASKPASKAKKSPVKPTRHLKKIEPKKTLVKKPASQKPTAKQPSKAKTKSVAKAASTMVTKAVSGKSKPVVKALEKKSTPKPAMKVKGSGQANRVARQKPAPAPVQSASEPFKAAPSVATNLKPRKNQAGLGVKELEHFWDLLRAKRRELVGDMSSMEREALRSGSATNLSTLPMHMADMGTDNFEQEFTLGLVEKDRNLLREINNALSKIQNGTYGICEGTGMPISKARLEAAPWSRFSIEYARQKEKNGMGVRTI